MDLLPNEAQQELSALSRRILTQRATPERLREIETAGDRFDPALWADLARAGILAAALPESLGGAGLGLLEQCSILAEIGRTVAPAPYLASIVLGAGALARFGTPDQQNRWAGPAGRGELILTAALSGANAALYISSRMLFSLARTGWAPPALGRLSAKGTPTLALLVSSYGIIVALVLERWAPAKAFEYILRGAFFGMMLSWITSLAAHISFRRRLTAAQAAEIPARSPLGKCGSIVGLVVVVAAIAKTWWDSRINLIAGLTFLIALTFLYLLLRPNAKQSNSRKPQKNGT